MSTAPPPPQGAGPQADFPDPRVQEPQRPAPSEGAPGDGGSGGRGRRGWDVRDVWRGRAARGSGGGDQFMPVFSIVLGGLLAVADVVAEESSWWVRGPALIAAFILVAQGFVDNAKARKVEQTVEDYRRYGGVVERRGDVVHVITDAAGRRQLTTPEQTRRIAGSSDRDSPGVLYFVGGLAVWLGIATLAHTSTTPLPLLALSLIAALVLFSSVWGLLQERR